MTSTDLWNFVVFATQQLISFASTFPLLICLQNDNMSICSLRWQQTPPPPPMRNIQQPIWEPRFHFCS